MSDRIAVMNDGLIEQLGAPREIYEHPASRFVVGFIGTSNVLSGIISRVNGEHAIITRGDSERIAVPLRNRECRSGTSVGLTVRPEKIELSAGRPPSSCAVRGVVTDVVYLGTSTTFSVQAAGTTLTVFQQNSTSASPAERGDQVWLPEDSCLLGANP